MSYVLNTKERTALNKLSFDRGVLIKGQFPAGIGPTTLGRLTDLGLAEVVPSERYRGSEGWRITPDGWRCMFGRTYDELMSTDGPHHPLKVWRWPPMQAENLE